MSPWFCMSSNKLFKYCFLIVIISIRPYIEHSSPHGIQRGFLLVWYKLPGNLRSLGQHLGLHPTLHSLSWKGSPSCQGAVVKGAAILAFRPKELRVRHKWNPQLPIYLAAICSSANRDFCWVIDDGVLRMATSLWLIWASLIFLSWT